jgi:hypothetical protein
MASALHQCHRQLKESKMSRRLFKAAAHFFSEKSMRFSPRIERPLHGKKQQYDFRAIWIHSEKRKPFHWYCGSIYINT